jgi:DNA modification methylase
MEAVSRVGVEDTMSKKLGIEPNNVYCMDCIEGMKLMPNNSVDLIITDPPFNIGKKYNSPYKDHMHKEAYIAWCKKWLAECIRILKPKGSLYLFNYPENNAYLMPYLDQHLFFKRWLTWHYPTNTGMSKFNFTRTQHSILFYSKSKNQGECIFNRDEIAEPYKNPTDKRIKALVASGKKGRTPYDVFNMNIVKNVSKDRTEHVCQLPVPLIEIFVKASSNKGDVVFDPFMGSGTTAVAAKKNGRKYVGFEISSAYHKIVLKRIEHTAYQPKIKDY